MGALALAAATAVLPGVGEHRLTLVLLMVVVLAPLMWSVEAWAGPRGMLWSQSALDATLCVLFALMLPEHWMTIALIGVLVVTANVNHLRPLGYLAIMVGLNGGLAVAAVRGGIEGGELSMAVVMTITLPVAAYSQWLRSRERLAMHQFDDMTQSVAAIVWEADPSTGRLRHLMGPTEEVTGHGHGDFAALYPDALVHPEDLALLAAELPADGTRVERTVRIQHADGRWLWIREVVGRVPGEQGAEWHRGVAMDITDLAESGEELRKRAEQDTLTGLMNRAAIVDDIRRRLASGAPVGVLLMDLDGFKAVNDTMGHLVGDRLLTVQSRRLEAVARREDAVGRLGGDEFVVISSAVGEQALLGLARRVRHALCQPVSLDGVEVGCSASVGAAWSPDHGVTHDELMRHADEAMYRAKRGGLGVQAFSNQSDPHHEQRIDRLEALTDRLEQELELWFQPIVDTDTLETTAYEGLVRWRHPDEGVLAPIEFLDLVESSGLTARFDTHVITLGARQAAAMKRAGSPMIVAVNITSRGLSDRSFPRRFRDILAAHDVEPSLMAIEVSERSVDADQRVLLEALAELRSLGVRIALDDFGTGYSSLTRLRQLPISDIKIDRSFVSAMTSSPADEIIVRSTIEMARELGLGVIAEGVSDEATLARLQQLGCSQVQGFLFAPATPEGYRVDSGYRRVEAPAGVSPADVR
jgi:diguanylate cyclase (GGDEF)-like protein